MKWTTAAILLVLCALPLGSCAQRNGALTSQGAGSPRSAHDRKVIFTLAGRNQTLTVVASRMGPLYSVTDNTGRVLLADSTLDQVQQRDPALYRWINSALCATSAAQ